MTPQEILADLCPSDDALGPLGAEMILDALGNAGYAVVRDSLSDWTDPWESPPIRWDATGATICRCGHGETEHNTDRAKLPCQTGGCGCQSLRPHYRLVRGHTSRRVYLAEVPVDGPEEAA